MKVTHEFLKSCKDGDRRSQKLLYERCFRPMMLVCYRYADCKDDAVDLLNIAFLKVINNLDKYNEEVPFEAWIKRITVNSVIDEFRKNKKYKEMIQTGDLTTAEFNVADVNEADRKLDAESILKLVGQLPNVTRSVFNLFAIDGYSHKEIAEKLSISEGTSKWHVNFARTKLKEMLKGVFSAVKSIIL